MGRIATFICCFLLAQSGAFVWAQSQTSPEKGKDGVFEITLKTPDPKRKMTVDELVRDRDLNPSALFRVKTGGYLAFDYTEWVDKVEFKVSDQSVTELPEYKKFAALLVEINRKAWSMKEVFGKYDQLALRMMNMCDRSRFPTLQAIDEDIAQQLTVYRRLTLLRSLVVNSLDRFVSDRSCKDKYADYRRTLAIYTKQLDNISKDYERLTRRVLALSKDAGAVTKKSDKADKAQDEPPAQQ